MYNTQHATCRMPYAACHIQHELLFFLLRSMEAAAGIEQFARLVSQNKVKQRAQ